MYLVMRWGTFASAGLGLIAAALSVHAAPPVLDFTGPITGGYAQFNFTAISASIYAGDPLKYAISSPGATSFDVQGLPAGLTVDPTTGIISGTPTQSGTFSLHITASNLDGSTSAYVSMAVQPVPSGPPVVTPLPDRETVYLGSYLGNDYGNYYEWIAISASQRPTSYAINGFPTGTVDVESGPVDTTAKYALIVMNKGGGVPGIHTCTVSATNEFGTGSTTFTWKIHPALVDYGITTTKPVYYLGDTVTFTADFTGPVIVTGQPTISTNNGPAIYSSGSGTSTLTFTYQTKPGDGPYSGIVTEHIDPNGGSIASPEGLDAKLTAPAVRDTSPPSYSVFIPAFPSATGSGTVGTAFTLRQDNQPGTASFTLASGTLPSGLNLDTNTGDITGTPTAPGTFAFAVKATAPTGQFVAQDMSITINASGSGPATPPDNSPPPTTKSDQTIAFSSPVSAILVGQPITLGALSSAGLPITYTVVSGDATLSGNTLTPNSTATLIVRASSIGSNQVEAASVDVNFGNPQKAPQSIQVATPTGTVPAEQPITLVATSGSGLPVTYTVVSGAATISGNTLTFTGIGTVAVQAAQAGDATHGAADPVILTFTATPLTRLVNLSSRVYVTPGDASHGAIAGFVIAGSAPKQILIRAVGQTLGSFGVTTGIPDPQLQIFDGDSHSIATNSGWNNDAAIAAAGDSVGAFKLGANNTDAALLLTVAPGLYTAQVASAHAGVVLIEVYDVASTATVPTKQLINISTRGVVGAGDDALVAGFVVAGDTPKRVLIRGIGPGLSSFGVSDVLADPMLTLYDAHRVVLARNDNWETTHAGDVLPLSTTASDITAADTSVGAFALPPGSKDAALVVTLSPGLYSAIVSGANNGTGGAMVEVYELPDAEK